METFLGSVKHPETYTDCLSTTLYMFLAELKDVNPETVQIDVENFICPHTIEDLFNSGVADMRVESESHGVRMVVTSDGLIEIYATDEGMDRFGLSPTSMP